MRPFASKVACQAGLTPLRRELYIKGAIQRLAEARRSPSNTRNGWTRAGKSSRSRAFSCLRVRARPLHGAPLRTVDCAFAREGHIFPRTDTKSEKRATKARGSAPKPQQSQEWADACRQKLPLESLLVPSCAHSVSSRRASAHRTLRFR